MTTSEPTRGIPPTFGLSGDRIAGQDEEQTPDGMWLVAMGAFQLNLLVYKAISTKVDVFHKEQRRSGPFGWWGAARRHVWVPANADSIMIKNTYYGATAAAANALRR